LQGGDLGLRGSGARGKFRIERGRAGLQRLYLQSEMLDDGGFKSGKIRAESLGPLWRSHYFLERSDDRRGCGIETESAEIPAREIKLAPVEIAECG